MAFSIHRHMLLVAVSLVSTAADTRVPLKVFTDLGLTAKQTAAIDAGTRSRS